MRKCRAIVLRKTPYRESSLIIATLSDQHGRLDFLIRGARSVGAKKFPVVDLFRELEVEFKEKSEGLHPLYHVEATAQFDALANDSQHFSQACAIAAFLVRNTHENVPCPRTYAALKNALSHLARNDKKHRFWDVLVKLVFLEENGLLPEFDIEDSNAKESDAPSLLKRLVSFASGELDTPPTIGAAGCAKLADWVDAVCAYHDLLQVVETKKGDA